MPVGRKGEAGVDLCEAVRELLAKAPQEAPLTEILRDVVDVYCPAQETEGDQPGTDGPGKTAAPAGEQNAE